MKNIKTFIVLLVLVLACASGTFAQTTTTKTSLSADLAGGTANSLVNLVSVSGITASTSSAQTFIFVGGEQMQVQSVNSTANTVTVRRAARGDAVPHLTGEPVWYGTPGTFNLNTGTTYGVFVGSTPYGKCTRTSNQYLPVINPNTGDITDCIVSPALGSPTAANATTSRWFSYNVTQSASAKPYKKLAVTASTYTATPADHIIGYNTNVNGTITLPALTGWIGKEYRVQIEITGTHSVTIATSSGQTINGASSIVIGGATSFGGILIYSDGVNWFAARTP